MFYVYFDWILTIQPHSDPDHPTSPPSRRASRQCNFPSIQPPLHPDNASIAALRAPSRLLMKLVWHIQMRDTRPHCFLLLILTPQTLYQRADFFYEFTNDNKVHLIISYILSYQITEIKTQQTRRGTDLNYTISPPWFQYNIIIVWQFDNLFSKETVVVGGTRQAGNDNLELSAL